MKTSYHSEFRNISWEEDSFLFWCTHRAFCTVPFIYLFTPSVGPEFCTLLAAWTLLVT